MLSRFCFVLNIPLLMVVVSWLAPAVSGRPCHAQKILSRGCFHLLTVQSLTGVADRFSWLLTTRITHSIFNFTCQHVRVIGRMWFRYQSYLQTPKSNPAWASRTRRHGVSHPVRGDGVKLAVSSSLVFSSGGVKLYSCVWHYISEPVISGVMTWFAKTQVVKFKLFEVT